MPEAITITYISYKDMTSEFSVLAANTRPIKLSKSKNEWISKNIDGSD